VARFDEVARTYTSSETAESALEGLVWDVACDVVVGSIPETVPDITQWLVARAGSFGLEFIGDGVGVIADALFSSIDSESEQADAAEACGRIPQSGF
jgi:hypothetical protein